MSYAEDILSLAQNMREKGSPFVLATVVRALASTCAKPGAKAIILPNGTFSEGWIGSGCTRGAVLKAAKDALEDGQSRLISVQPGDVLAERGVAPGDERDGVHYAKNSCLSRGCMDIFVEPMLPRPEMFVCGSSPVAVATAELAAKLGYAVTACAPAGDQEAFPQVEKRIEGYALPPTSPGERFIVVSTQGRGDDAALQGALAVDADYVAFIASSRKAEALKAKLQERGLPADRLARLKAPAGLDIHAVTPEEIALSILAEIVAFRRSQLKGRAHET
jgi:xanthine dehydrogenase accessory factor